MENHNYLTPEEEYELMYSEELKMMDEQDESTLWTQKNQPPSNVNSTSVIISSPALSQISKYGGSMQFTSATKFRKLDLDLKKTSTPRLSIIETDDKERKTESVLNEIQNVGLRRRKRRLEDLFGDIYDIEEEDDDMNLKKYKTEEEKDFETIFSIIEARKKYDVQFNPSKKHENRFEVLHKFKKDNLSMTIPKYPFISLSNQDNDRIYVRFHSEEFEKQKIQEIKTYDLSEKKFFSQSEQELLWQEANEIILTKNEKSLQQSLVEIHKITSSIENADLWVQKYKSKRYLDLLSDEALNRSLLIWIKLWDKIVFKREIIKKNIKSGELNSFNKKTGKFEQNGGWLKGKRQKGNLNTDLDPNGVPFQKIALIVGKPGLGKTTLAHVIAKHAGYELREMNASDERQLDDFRQILENCTQNRETLNRDKRPNCIILDEIDGAPAASIDYLIRFVTGQVSEKSKKGKTLKKFVLKRPIICICNDLYGANLRQLRQIAFVVNVQAIDNARLAERLMQICNKERIKTDMTAMLSLAEKTGGDIRLSISMLQFFNSLKKPITLFDVLKSNVGQKDQHKTLFNAWNEIFSIKRPQKIIKEFEESKQKKQIVGMSDMSLRTRASNVIATVNSCGEYEKLTQGVFENFLKQKYHDANMEGIVEASNWFCFNDNVQSKINNLQNYVIYPYLQFAFIHFNYTFASLTYPQITYPQKNFEFSSKLSTSKQIFENLKKGATSMLCGIGSGNANLMDTISLLKLIIYPEIRPVSMHLLTQNERNDLKHTVEIIADFGLSFLQFQTNDGTYTYRSQPDIDHFSFSDIPTKQITYWSKQMIAQEVEIEKIKRSRPKIDTEQEHMEMKKSEILSKNQSPENKGLPNHLQRLIPKSIKIPKTNQLVCRDFFGRIISKPVVLTSKRNEESSSDVLVKSPIWLKYKEGFNNAVRTDYHFSDLL